jgi:hypothetical protein
MLRITSVLDFEVFQILKYLQTLLVEHSLYENLDFKVMDVYLIIMQCEEQD